MIHVSYNLDDRVESDVDHTKKKKVQIHRTKRTLNDAPVGSFVLNMFVEFYTFTPQCQLQCI
jgi:hypothetical protein